MRVAAAQIESLQLAVGTSLSVYVTGVRSPQDFTVQPLGTDLISMMEAIGLGAIIMASFNVT